MRAQAERQWLTTPEQFDIERNCVSFYQWQRLLEVVTPHLKPGMRVADLGFGSGALSLHLTQKGALVDAVETSQNAINLFLENGGKIEGLELHRATLPETALPDNFYDLVICADVIAELHPQDQRLLISEMVRLIKSDGKIIISTPFDIDTEGGWELLAQLCGTEMLIDEWHFNFHAYFLRCNRFFHEKLSHSRFLMGQLEKLCRFFDPEGGISHAIFVGHPKPLEIPDRRGYC